MPAPLLFSVETDRVRVAWRCGSARCAHPEGGTPDVHAVRLDEIDGLVRVDVADGATVLAEETLYRVTVESKGGETIEIRHEDPVVGGAFERLAPGLVHGVFSFGSAVGRSRFVVDVDGRPHLALTVEVFPSKLDYRRDFRALVADVGRIADDLALQIVAAAYLGARPEPARGGPLTRATLLAHLADDLDAALAFAFRTPLRAAAPAPALVPAHRTRRASPALERRLGRGAAGTEEADARPLRLPGSALAWTSDVPEHRYLAAHLRAAAHDARRLAARQPSSARGRAGRERLAALATRLDALVARGPLADVPPEAPPPGAAPLRLSQAPGYREAAHLVRLLRGGLGLGAGLVRARPRALHRLYELWAYLAVAEACARLASKRLPAHRLVRASPDGTRLRLRRAPLVFRMTDGVRLVLRAHPRLDAPGALLAQRPDLLIERHDPRGGVRLYLLDAKYRLDRSPGYLSRHGVPGPPEAALGLLHRYRDAVVDEAGDRPVVAAAAVYPWRDDDRYPGSRLAGSLAGIGVGAIPALPGATFALRAWLARIAAGEV